MMSLQQLTAPFARWDESEGALGRHSVLLASLVVLLVALPLLNVLAGGDTSFSILLALVLMAAVLVNTPQRWSFITASIIGFGAIAGLAASAMTASLLMRTLADVLGLGLLGFTTLLMLNSLIHARRVSPDTIVGGICVYLLIGQLYLAIFVARLVALYVAGDRRRPRLRPQDSLGSDD